MRTGKTEVKRRVWIGLLAGFAGLGGWGWWWWSQPLPPAGPAEDPQPFVRLAGGGTASGSRILQERAELLDPTPLFFPTEWNFGQQPLSETNQRIPGQVFGRFEAKMTVDEQEIAKYGAGEVEVPEKLTDVLVQGNEAPFAGLGRRDTQKATLAVRAAYLEIRDMRNGNNILSQALTGFQSPRADYAPIEFLVVIGSAGLIGDPIITSGSGWEEVDNFFRTYLVKSYHLGERLPPGRYRVLVGA